MDEMIFVNMASPSPDDIQPRKMHNSIQQIIHNNSIAKFNKSMNWIDFRSLNFPLFNSDTKTMGKKIRNQIIQIPSK